MISHRKYDDNFVNVQLGSHPQKVKNTTRPMLGHFAKSGTIPYKTLKEFRTFNDFIPDIGSRIGAEHFAPGHYVNVTGTTIGKGFQGAMKRHGFGGGYASHGASKSHRSLGSTGSSQGPGKVWKGKKMPGRMGNRKTVQRKLLVYRIDKINNLLWIRGSIPGHKGNKIYIQDYAPSQRIPIDLPDGDILQVKFHYDNPDFLRRKKTFLDAIIPSDLPDPKQKIQM